MITANQFFRDNHNHDDTIVADPPKDLFCRWRRVSRSSWRMERKDDDAASAATPPATAAVVQQEFASRDGLLPQHSTSGVGVLVGQSDVSYDGSVLEMESFVQSANFDAVTFGLDRHGVQISAPLRLTAKTLTKDLLAPASSIQEDASSFCMAAMNHANKDSPLTRMMEFSFYSGTSDNVHRPAYVPAGYEGFEALGRLHEAKEESSCDVTATYYIMEIKAKGADGSVIIDGAAILEDVYLILDDNPTDCGAEEGKPEHSSSYMMSAGGLKAKVLASTVWMNMIEKRCNDGDISCLLADLEGTRPLSLPQPIGSSWKVDGSNSSLLLVVSLDGKSVKNQSHWASEVEKSILNGNLLLKFRCNSILRQNPLESQLLLSHFSVVRGVHIVRHVSTEQKDAMKSLELALARAERFVPAAKKRQWGNFPDVIISVLPHPALPFNIALWLRDRRMRKSDFDPSIGNLVFYLPYWQRFNPPNCHYLDMHTMVNQKVWQDLFLARSNVEQCVARVRDCATLHEQNKASKSQHVIDAHALHKVACSIESNDSLGIVPPMDSTQMLVGYIERMLTAVSSERLRVYEDMKQHDLYSVHWNGYIEIPPSLTTTGCPMCRSRAPAQQTSLCMYHMAALHYHTALGRTPPEGKSIAIRTRVQLESLPRLLSMFPGESLIGKLTVPGLAENFPLISIGDLLRLRFSCPRQQMNTEVVGEVADVIVITEQVTIRLPSPFQRPNVTMGCLPYLQSLLYTNEYVVDALPLLQFGIPPSIEALAITDSNRKEILDRFRFDVRFGFQGGRGYDIIVQSLGEFFEPTAPALAKEKKNTSNKILSTAQQIHLNRSLLPTTSLCYGSLQRNDRKARLNQENYPPLKFQTLVNLEQQQAVTDIAYCYHGPAPYIIEGPAGTGKTLCVCEAIIQVLRTHSGAKILVCAPSDAACDVVASRLLSIITPGNCRLLRINWWSRKLASVKPEIISHCPMDETSGLFTVPNMAEIKKADIVVCQCIVAECLELAGPRGWTKGHFSHLFIDECSQAMECETLVPIAKVGYTCSIVLAGDPKQLGPSIRDPLAASMGLGISIQDRLSKLPLYTSDGVCVITRLVRNYRSNEALLTVPSSLFYGGSLQCFAPKEVSDPFANLGALGPAGFPLLLCNVPDGKERSKLDTPSFYNLEECQAIMMLARGLLRCTCQEGVEPLHTGQICVITPFRAQVLALRKLLRGSNLGGINVGVVEDFQGQESKVVFISTVLTQNHPRWNCSKGPSHADGVEQRFGFLHDPKKFNVAVTRAHALCVVVGNAAYLEQSGTYWSVLLDHIRRNGGILGDDEEDFENEDDRAAHEDDQYGVADLLRRVEELKLLGSGTNEDMHDLSYYYSDAPQWKVMLS